MKAPECHLCAHYFVTWKPDRPRGCRAFGFETSAVPSAVVRASSGKPCQLFEPGPRAARDEDDERGRPR